MSEIVKDLSTLLSKILSPNESIKNTNYTMLTAPGDNFGSIMLKLDVTIFNRKTKEEKLLNLAAKILPASEKVRQIFNVQTTFTNELAFYDIILPTLQTFQRELGVKVIDSFAKCYGTRKNLLGNCDTINDDAVLLLENLKIQGYSNVTRSLGFDFETIKLILTDLAQFHASFLALKLQKPEVFNRIVRPYCHDFEPPRGGHQFYQEVLGEIGKEDEECSKLIPKVKFWGELIRSPPREPYATVIHTDLWTHNTMQLFIGGKPTVNKFVDFQVFTYGSPASDVFFILWSSVQQLVLENHLNFLLQLYHDEFIATLKNHKCDVSPFSYSKFMDELKLEAEYEFPHSLEFLFHSVNLHAMETVKSIPPHFKEKVQYMVKECNRRGWLY